MCAEFIIGSHLMNVRGVQESYKMLVEDEEHSAHDLLDQECLICMYIYIHIYEKIYLYRYIYIDRSIDR